MHTCTINNHISIVDGVVGLGSILAEDDEWGAAAQGTKAQCHQHQYHENVKAIVFLILTKEVQFLFLYRVENFLTATGHDIIEWVKSELSFIWQSRTDGFVFLYHLVIGTHGIPFDITECIERGEKILRATTELDASLVLSCDLFIIWNS